MVIGLVIHASHRAVFEDAARTLAGVSLEWVVYEHEDEVRVRVDRLLARQRVDGLLLGPVPYAKCRHLLPADLPVAILRSAGLDLSLALFKAVARGWRPTPVSIDTFDAQTVDEVTRALDLDPARVTCLPYDPEQSVAGIVAFHREALARTGADYVISLRTAVAAELGGETHVLGGLPGPATLRAQLHELALRVQSKQASALRFAAGVFLVAKAGPQLDLDRARVGLMNLLLNTPEFADAWIENRGRRGVVVFAHQALFEKATSSWVSLPALSQALEALGIRVAAGFGVGASARSCVHLAERAANRAEQEESPSAFLIEDGGVIIGPMSPAGAALTFTYREHGAELERLAGEVGLSAATLSRLAAIERGQMGRAISPSDLAQQLGITDPSGRRLIRKLGDSGLVEVEGSTQVHRKGRPARLYRLRIGAAIERP
ncbi:helix-turn-helix domain-containing protein [Micromonospora sp. NBC_01796]|uniref:helix-turn-helix domain-containing protein n=1 Tax=Micromonospora sp. NBC_01796 TaxID=2975987 RepID=UPI002DD7A931|nr:helix-turn-helix domain-containing protein [Micromonospora sp. NBC_01796]WSA85878.1 MarR family transcriptional regulator [Micromonospora sp. NBC_01796]